MENNELPFLTNKVSVFYHACEHGQDRGFKSCNSFEIALTLKSLHSKAIVIVGVYDSFHLSLYKEAVLKSGINPLLVKVVDYRWGDKAIEEAKLALERNWIASKAPVKETKVNLSRREIL
ncbi:hypothetical protein HLB03_07720, partial [Acidianus sp. DSM 29099]|nr:hypothetical protein [Acidianus sp. RZ1]